MDATGNEGGAGAAPEVEVDGRARWRPPACIPPTEDVVLRRHRRRRQFRLGRWWWRGDRAYGTPGPCGDSSAQAGAGPGPPKVAGGDSRRHSGDDEPAARTPGIPALHQARAGSRRFAFTIARGRPAVRARSSTSFPTFRPAEQMLPRCCSFSHRLIHIGGEYVETRRQIRFEGSWRPAMVERRRASAWRTPSPEMLSLPPGHDSRPSVLCQEQDQSRLLAQHEKCTYPLDYRFSLLPIPSSSDTIASGQQFSELSKTSKDGCF